MRDFFLIFTAITFWIFYLGSICLFTHKYLKDRKRLKAGVPPMARTDFNSYIKKLKEEGEKVISSNIALREKPKERKPEVHKFQWRHDGKMNEVEIIIDPNIDATLSGSREEFEALVKSGDMAKLEEVLSKISGTKEAEQVSKVDKFIFSKKSVDQMRIAGVSPDELVAKMLKAAGRMD